MNNKEVGGLKVTSVTLSNMMSAFMWGPQEVILSLLTTLVLDRGAISLWGHRC